MAAAAVLAIVGGLWLIWAGITGESLIDLATSAFR